MRIFNKKSDLPDVDRLFHKKNYTKLIKLLLSDNSTIVEKATNALNDLAIEEQAIQERKDLWNKNNYAHLIKKLDSDKFASFKILFIPCYKHWLMRGSSLFKKNKKKKIRLKKLKNFSNNLIVKFRVFNYPKN